MRLLLDTHAFLWFVTDDRLLSVHAKSLIADSTNEIIISAVGPVPTGHSQRSTGSVARVGAKRKPGVL